MYNILEIANTHGGNIDYIFSLIDEFGEFKNNIGIKFQPFKYDKIALKDYKDYNIYKDLFFTPKQWSKIIIHAAKTKDIWLDIFDLYSVEILTSHFDSIIGIKLQASVLYNELVVSHLSRLNFEKIMIILNISGFEIFEIDLIIRNYESLFNKSEILIEIGFQGYPTQLQESGISKINKLKESFPNRLVFADHIDTKKEDALWLPIIASLKGVHVIEKHIKHSTLDTKYDHYSAMDYLSFKKYLSTLERYVRLEEQPFICNSEKEYLLNTQQIPILNKYKNAGELLSWDDFEFKRTNKLGLKTTELEKFISNGYCLRMDKTINSTIKREDLKKITVGTIIAVRLKSSRLKRKALKKIGNLTSIEYCIKNALKFNGINHTIVATSNLDEDAELKNFTYNKSVVFHKGDPDDVIKRYLLIARKLKIDVIIRVTGDNPFISSDILDILIKSHYNSGSDYTVAKEAAVGTNLEIINTVALEKVHRHFPMADYSEYMTWYFQNNPEHFKLNYVDLPKRFVREYRLTLDYDKDLDLFNKIDEHFVNKGVEYSIVELFEFLDNNPNIANINSGLTIRYKTDQNLIDTLNKAVKIE
ncbi:MAG: N-acetylneuraminate synthase family protein [Bacteroidales bacterium]|nr:N-acetylneuraminate synthase family protein [Bacteroidales bacterium]